MEAKGETMMSTYWTIRAKDGLGDDRGRYFNKDFAMAALWKARCESQYEQYLVRHTTISKDEMRKRSETQAKRIANALINYTIDNSATQGAIQYIATNAILDFAQEIMDGKR